MFLLFCFILNVHEAKVHAPQVWAAYDAAGAVCLGGGQIDSTDRLGVLLAAHVVVEQTHVMCLPSCRLP